MIPKTYSECQEALNKELNPASQIEFMQLTRKELNRTHHGLGQWIRNNWGLWAGGPLFQDMKTLGFTHPDDMSGTIIKEYWLYLNKLPSEIAQDIEIYNKHWAAIEKGEVLTFNVED